MDDLLKPITIQAADGSTQDVDPSAMFQRLSVADPLKPITFKNSKGEWQQATAGAFKTAIASRVQGAPPQAPSPASVLTPVKPGIPGVVQDFARKHDGGFQNEYDRRRAAMPPAANHVEALKQDYAVRRSMMNPAIAGSFAGAPNSLLGLSGPKLDDLTAGLSTLPGAVLGGHEADQNAALNAVQKGGLEAGKIGSAALISAYHGAKTGGPIGAIGGALASTELGNDDPVTTAMAGEGAKLGQLVGKSSPVLARLLTHLGGIGGANAGTLMQGKGTLPWQANLGFGALGAADTGMAAWTNALRQSPAFISSQIANDLKAKGVPLPDAQFAPPGASQFSSLAPPQLSLPQAGGAAAMAPGMAMPNPLEAIIGHLKDIAGTTASWGKTAAGVAGRGALAAQPAVQAATSNPATLGAIFSKGKSAKGPGKTPPPNAPVAGVPEPPENGDNKKREQGLSPAASGGGPAMAGSGGPVSPLGPEGLPANAPRSGVVAADGALADLRIPESDVRYRTKYRLRELKDVIASHDPHSFNYDPRYPYENERDYSFPANQDHVTVNSAPGKLEPGDLINTNNQATSGPPIVTPEGHVMGGNGRTLILKRAMANADDAARYRAHLKANAGTFGLDPAAVDTFKQPVLVRELQGAPENIKANAQNIIADLNVDPQKAKSLEEQAISDSKRLQPEHWDTLGKIIEESPEEGGIRAVLDDPQAGNAILKHLTEETRKDAQGNPVVIRPGVFRQAEMGKLVSPEGALTPAAKDRIENMLVGRFFRDPKQMLNTPPAVKARLQRSGAALARLGSYPDWDFSHQIPDALSALEEGRARGFSNLRDLNRQPDFSGNIGSYDDSTLAIADALKRNGPVQFANRIKGYLADAEVAHGKATPDMFSEPADLPTAFGRTFEAKGLRPTPRPVKAASPAPVAAEPVQSAPVEQPPAAAEAAPAVEPGDHAAAAKRLDAAMADFANNNVKAVRDARAAGDPVKLHAALDVLHNDLGRAHTSDKIGDLGEVHNAIEAARQIKPDEFEIMSEFAAAHSRGEITDKVAGITYPDARAKAAARWQAAEPDKWQQFKDARDAVAERLGIMPEAAEDFVTHLAKIRAKVAGDTNWARVGHARASSIPLDQALIVAENASQHPNALARAGAPPARPQPQAQPARPAAAPQGPAGTPEQTTFFNRPLGQPAASPAEPRPQPIFRPKSQIKTRVDPKTGRTVPVEDAPADVIDEAQFRQGQRKPAPEHPGAPPVPPVPPVKETPVFRAPSQLKTRVDPATGKTVTVEPAAEPAPSPEWNAFVKRTKDRQGQPSAAPPAWTTEDLAKAQDAAKKLFARTVKEGDAKKLGEFLTSVYDSSTGTFQQTTARNKLAEFITANPGLVERATGGSAKELLDSMDRLNSSWGKLKVASGQGDGSARWRFSFPVGKLLGLPGPLSGIRVHSNPFNPLVYRRLSTLDPTSSAAAAMRHLAENPSTPSAFRDAMLRTVLSSTSQDDSTGRQ